MEISYKNAFAPIKFNDDMNVFPVYAEILGISRKTMAFQSESSVAHSKCRGGGA